jgi:hypothetical protein
MSRAMSRLGRPLLAGGSAAAGGKSGGSGGDPSESSASIGTGEDSEGGFSRIKIRA